LRIRSIKPEFYRSPDITDLAVEDRLLFIGLWSYVDDNGVGRDVESDIIGDLFSMDMFRESRETVARVSRGLSNLSERGLIVRYTVDERPFLFVAAWERHQRIDKPAKPRYPRPDHENAILATPSRDLREIPAPGTGEQGNRGTGEQNSPAPAVLASEFDRAWAHWPKKVERKQAAARFGTVARRMDVTEIVAHIIRFGDAYAETTERQFVPALGAWLNGERWTDELPTRRQANNVKQSRADENAADYYRYYGGNDERAGSVSALDAGIG
jgi:hypothetical protein